MIELLIFHFHIIAAIYAYTKNWQLRSVKDGILSIMIIGLFFSIGWSLTAQFAKIMPDAWSSSIFTRDTLSLVMLIIPESIFFYYFIFKDKN